MHTAVRVPVVFVFFLAGLLGVQLLVGDFFELDHCRGGCEGGSVRWGLRRMGNVVMEGGLWDGWTFK